MAATDGYAPDPAEVAAILAGDIDGEDHSDPTLLYLRATQLHTRYTAVCAELTQLRADAAAALHRDGMSYAQISAHLGPSRPRVQQLVQAGRP